MAVRGRDLVNARRHLGRCTPVRFYPKLHPSADLAHLKAQIKAESDAAIDLYLQFMRPR